MKKTIKKNSEILTSIHETALDLHKLGFIDKKKMIQYEALCLNPIPSYTPTKIKKLRNQHHISQAVLANILNTSLSTVRQWEIGNKKPSGPSAKLLDILDKKGIEALI
jgi:putative transcriptional regulator